MMQVRQPRLDTAGAAWVPTIVGGLVTRGTPVILAGARLPHIITTVLLAAQTNVGLPLLKGWALAFEC